MTYGSRVDGGTRHDRAIASRTQKVTRENRHAHTKSVDQETQKQIKSLRTEVHLLRGNSINFTLEN